MLEHNHLVQKGLYQCLPNLDGQLLDIDTDFTEH